MGYFPFFIDIAGKKGLIVGGGRIAAHKIEKLSSFGTRLTVVAPQIERELKENPALACLERAFLESDLQDCFFVVAASDDRELNHRVSMLCRERGILVNAVDEKEDCGFLFPALVKEGKLTVGICTEGASPRTAALLRSRIASELPGRTEEILDYLADLRGPAKERITEDGQRARFFKEMAELCMAENRIPDAAETDARMAFYAGEGERAEKEMGQVTLVGAGCGPHDLVTLRGLAAVRNAEVLVYDDLLDERLLEHAAESCEKIYVGKRMGRHSKKQEEINALLTEKAAEGRRVVRLKGGDPFVFGRGGEEILALREAGVRTAEVPGLTSAIAVLAAAGIPVTHRGLARSFHVVSARTGEGTDGLPEQLGELAGLNGTLIFLMGFHRIEELAQKLAEYGKPADTPAAAVHGGFDGNVECVRGTLSDIAQKVKASGMTPPAIFVVGAAAGLKLTDY